MAEYSWFGAASADTGDRDACKNSKRIIFLSEL
jgi:hypothetical protein